MRGKYKSVANGIVQSFVSRNSDIDGNWGIGVLAGYAVRKRLSEIEICVYPKADLIKRGKLCELAKKYNEMVEFQIRATHSKQPKLVVIELNFSEQKDGNSNGYLAQRWFDIKCSVEVTNSLDRSYSCQVMTSAYSKTGWLINFANVRPTWRKQEANELS